MTIRAGQMRHRIQIQVRALTPTETGEPDATWSLFAEVWSSVEPMLGGNEIVIAQQDQGRVPTRFRIRYLAGVVPRMRIVWPRSTEGTPRWFDITAVQMVGGIKHEMILVAEELVEVPPL